MQLLATTMFTSSFFQYSGPGRISIARGAPRGMEGFKVYRKLNPGSWFREPEFYNDQERYRERYFSEILAPLNPQHVWDELQRLVAGQGHPPVLLCYENISKPGQWCHRRMVASWFEQHLGMVVPELQIAKPPSSQPALF